MRVITIFLVATMISAACKADGDLRTFLVSSGYGTLIGAGLGAASLAFVDDPGSKASNIAKGASLGLYAGIGVGLYLMYSQPQSSGPADQAFWIQPTIHLANVDGATLNTILQF